MQIFGFPGAKGGRCLVVAAAAMLASGAVQAQSLGERLFNDSCASCHGVQGHGDGFMNQYLTTPAPSISGISKANDGVFPLVEVIAIIDGRKNVRTHGSNMPVWGSVFMKPLVGEISSSNAELVVKGRILALAEYLETLQE